MRLLTQGTIVAGSVLVADLIATEEKPRWRWAWDAVTTCGADSSHYAVSWPLWLLIVAMGFVLARRVVPGSKVAA